MRAEHGWKVVGGRGRAGARAAGARGTGDGGGVSRPPHGWRAGGEGCPLDPSPFFSAPPPVFSTPSAHAHGACTCLPHRHLLLPYPTHRSPLTPLLPLLSGRLECAKALLRAGADPNHVTSGGDLAIFWAIDGGVPMVQLFVEYGVDLDAVSPKVREERERTQKKTESVRAWMGGCFSLFFTPPPPHFNPRVAPLSSPSSVRVGPLSSMPSPRASTARQRRPGSTRKTSCGTTGRPRRGRGCLGRPAERRPGRRGRRSTRGRPALCGSGGRTRR